MIFETLKMTSNMWASGLERCCFEPSWRVDIYFRIQAWWSQSLVDRWPISQASNIDMEGILSPVTSKISTHNMYITYNILKHCLECSVYDKVAFWAPPQTNKQKTSAFVRVHPGVSSHNPCPWIPVSETVLNLARIWSPNKRFDVATRWAPYDCYIWRYNPYWPKING